MDKEQMYILLAEAVAELAKELEEYGINLDARYDHILTDLKLRSFYKRYY